MDDFSPSGFTDVFCPATGHAAPALEPAVKLYILLNDILGFEAQLNLTRYFQVLGTDFFMLFTFSQSLQLFLQSANAKTGCCEEEIKKALERDG